MNHAISALKFKIIKEFLELGWAVLLSDVDVILVQVPAAAQLCMRALSSRPVQGSSVSSGSPACVPRQCSSVSSAMRVGLGRSCMWVVVWQPPRAGSSSPPQCADEELWWL